MEYLQHAETGGLNTNARTAVQTFIQVRFEYVGKTPLTVIGNVTRKQYRFNYPGDKQNIDYRDVSGVMGMPELKRLR